MDKIESVLAPVMAGLAARGFQCSLLLILLLAKAAVDYTSFMVFGPVEPFMLMCLLSTALYLKRSFPDALPACLSPVHLEFAVGMMIFLGCFAMVLNRLPEPVMKCLRFAKWIFDLVWIGLVIRAYVY